jgi:hypothetical protein
MAGPQDTTYATSRALQRSKSKIKKINMKAVPPPLATEDLTEEIWTNDELDELFSSNLSPPIDSNS